MTTFLGLKVIVSRREVQVFNAGFPGSNLQSYRAYWFEFDKRGDLIDTDVPEHDDGDAAKALAEDCKAYLFEGRQPSWSLD